MKVVDMRLDGKVFKQMVGVVFEKYRCDEFKFTNTVTGVVGLFVGNNVFQLVNEVTDCDYFGSNDECAVWSIKEVDGEQIRSALENGKQIDTLVKNRIDKILLVNEKQIMFEDGVETYNVWVTRAMIFVCGNKEIAFIKDEVPFSEEIEILRGHDLLSSIPDNEFFTKEAEWEENIVVKCERCVVTISNNEMH